MKDKGRDNKRLDIISSSSTDMLEQHLNMFKNNTNNKSIVNKNKNDMKKKKKPESYIQKAKDVLKLREDQVKKYTKMLSTGK